jgi:hypothetical protein
MPLLNQQQFFGHCKKPGLVKPTGTFFWFTSQRSDRNGYQVGMLIYPNSGWQVLLRISPLGDRKNDNVIVEPLAHHRRTKHVGNMS